jgi:hypothetical protein
MFLVYEQMNARGTLASKAFARVLCFTLSLLTRLGLYNRKVVHAASNKILGMDEVYELIQEKKQETVSSDCCEGLRQNDAAGMQLGQRGVNPRKIGRYRKEMSHSGKLIRMQK